VLVHENKISQVLLRVSTEDADLDGCEIFTGFQSKYCLKPRPLKTNTFLFSRSLMCVPVVPDLPSCYI